MVNAGAIVGLLAGIVAVLLYLASAVRVLVRIARTVERLADEHTQLLAVAHRHDKITGRVIRLKTYRGGHRGR